MHARVLVGVVWDAFRVKFCVFVFQNGGHARFGRFEVSVEPVADVDGVWCFSVNIYGFSC